jgi:hypothetical protein
MIFHFVVVGCTCCSAFLTNRKKMSEYVPHPWHFLSDDDDEEEEDEDMTMLLLCAAAIAEHSDTRASFYVRDRLEWEVHVTELLEEDHLAFYQLYRMQHASFMKLCSLIHPFISTDEKMSQVRTGKGPITTEIALHCLLRWLSGGSYLDIRLCAGLSKSSFYFCVHKCVEAILLCDELAYSFPTSDDDIRQASKDFRECSTNNVIDGCVACLDGLLLRIRTPPPTATGNVKAYFSGHYQAYGINVQAACDSRCRFVYVSLAAPGGANDIAAFRKTSLSELIEKLPLGKYVIADNAYVCTEHLLTPFPGEQKKDPAKDAFNFYLSQLRIRIEMTFGRFVNKWRIFTRPMQVAMNNTGRVFMCATRLHNFCINEAIDNGVAPSSSSEAGAAVFTPSSFTTVSVQGNSMMRDILLQEITDMGLSRPAYNLERNRD